MPVAAITADAYAKRVARAEAAAKAKATDIEKMIPAVNAMDVCPATKKNYFIALYNATKDTVVAEQYKQQFLKCDEEAKKMPPPPPPNITYDEIQKAGLAIMNNTDVPLPHRILVGLSTQLNPLRLDYCNLPINPDDRKGNYILLNLGSPWHKASQVVINEHKTTKVMLKVFGDGSLVRTLTPQIYALIKQWHENNKDAILLEMPPNTLGKTLTRIFQKYANLHVTQNTIRHAYVTKARAGDRPLAVVSKIAKELGHSVATNELYRWENSAQAPQS